MPSISTFAIYFTAATLVLIVPGPAVLYIVTQGAHHGTRAALTAVLGVHTGTLMQVAAAALGLSWLLLSSAWAFTVVKYVGAAYLVYLGLKAILTRAERRAALPRSSRRLFTEGFLVNLLNPKLALFFVAFLPQFVDPARGGTTLQIAVLGLIFIALGLCTDGAYALLSGVAGPWLRGRTRVLRGERFVVGGTFLGLGAVTALSPVTKPQGS
jgi:threonine/homoserine/homoserine lactone efflux protein